MSGCRWRAVLPVLLTRSLHRGHAIIYSCTPTLLLHLRGKTTVCAAGVVRGCVGVGAVPKSCRLHGPTLQITESTGSGGGSSSGAAEPRSWSSSCSSAGTRGRIVIVRPCATRSANHSPPPPPPNLIPPHQSLRPSSRWPGPPNSARRPGSKSIGTLFGNSSAGCPCCGGSVPPLPRPTGDGHWHWPKGRAPLGPFRSFCVSCFRVRAPAMQATLLVPKKKIVFRNTRCRSTGGASRLLRRCFHTLANFETATLSFLSPVVSRSRTLFIRSSEMRRCAAGGFRVSVLSGWLAVARGSSYSGGCSASLSRRGRREARGAPRGPAAWPASPALRCAGCSVCGAERGGPSSC